MSASSFKKASNEKLTQYAPIHGRRNRTGETVGADQILKNLLKRHGLDIKIAKYQFVAHWEELVGKKIADRAKPDCIKGRTLIIKVKSSSWAQELSFHKTIILGRVNKFFTPDEMLTDIRFVVGV